MIKISVIIPVYNEAAMLKPCLEALVNQTIQPHEVIVVDNNSSDDSVRIAKAFKFVRVIKESRQGTVYARAAGFDAAKGDILARIDADTRLPSDWLETVQDHFVTHPATAAITGKPNFYGVASARLLDSLQVLFYQHFQSWLTGGNVLWGANMAIRQQAWGAVRKLCSLRTDLDEDIDLSFCLHEKRLKIKFLPNLKAAASFQRGRLGPIYTVQYLAKWPRDYLHHSMPIRALLISCLVGLAVLISPALAFVTWLSGRLHKVNERL